MTKRIADAVALCECESQDCSAELPIKKRLKLLQDDYDASISDINTMPPLIKLLPEVACVLAEISDDEDCGSSVTSDQSSASVKDVPKIAPRHWLPAKSNPLPAPSRFLPSFRRRVITKYNYCPSGKPLASPPKLLYTSKVVLKEIDSTLL